MWIGNSRLCSQPPLAIRTPAGLNTQLQDLPARPDTFYIHDVALSEDGATIYAAGHHKIAVLGMQS